MKSEGRQTEAVLKWTEKRGIQELRVNVQTWVQANAIL